MARGAVRAGPGWPKSPPARPKPSTKHDGPHRAGLARDQHHSFTVTAVRTPHVPPCPSSMLYGGNQSRTVICMATNVGTDASTTYMACVQMVSSGVSVAVKLEMLVFSSTAKKQSGNWCQAARRCPVEGLLEETTDYIAALKAQVASCARSPACCPALASTCRWRRRLFSRSRHAGEVLVRTSHLWPLAWALTSLSPPGFGSSSVS